MKRFWLFMPLLLSTNLLSLSASKAEISKNLQVRVNRWLEVSQLAGTVIYQRGQKSEPARKGTRLQAVGDTLKTGNGSSALLQVDTDTGAVSLSANTTVRVQQLQTTADGGKVTRLKVSGGQARFQVRKFTHPDSQLEIETPAGSSAVRGTEFGVSVHPDGKTGVATREGSVLVSAQNQSLLIEAGYEVLLIPGLPPRQPQPIPAISATTKLLNLRLLTAVDRSTARIVATVNPLNLVKIANVPQIVANDGQLDVTVPMPQNRRIEVVVITPIGQQQVYELAVP